MSLCTLDNRKINFYTSVKSDKKNYSIGLSFCFRNLLDFHKKQNNEATIAVKKFEVENPYGVVRMSKEKVFLLSQVSVQNTQPNLKS